MMSGSGGNDFSLQGISDQCQVTHHIQEFVTCRFVREMKVYIIKYPLRFYFNMRLFEQVGHSVQLFL